MPQSRELLIDQIFLRDLDRVPISGHDEQVAEAAHAAERPQQVAQATGPVITELPRTVCQPLGPERLAVDSQHFGRAIQQVGQMLLPSCHHLMIAPAVHAKTTSGVVPRTSAERLASIMEAMRADLPTVTVTLWRADAVVLFDWLMSTDLNAVPITHPAQKQALADLLSRLEYAAAPDITRSTAEEIAEAQHQVGRDMSW